MPKWTDYTKKTALKDNDELMILDTDANANKRTTIGKVANNTAFSGLKTANKTLVGGINEVMVGNDSLVEKTNKLTSKVAGFAMGNPKNLGGTFNKPPSASEYYRCIQLDSTSSQSGDRYFLLIDSLGKLFTGRALNGATEITWVEK